MAKTPEEKQNKKEVDPVLDSIRVKLNRRQERKAETEGKKPPEPKPVSAGPIDKVVDMALNPSREKILEFTVLDRNQARLLPQLNIVDQVWEYLIDIAEYRYDTEEYVANHPESPIPSLDNLMEEFMYRTAQCQKSLDGKNLQSAIDLALADIETRNNDDPFGGAGSGYGDED